MYEDASVNGLQVEASESDIKVVALAVDSGQSVIEKACSAEADLLIVHHGLLWGACEPVAGRYGKKIATLLSKKCSLYASHIPLDAHSEVGNNFEMARFFGLTDIQPYFTYRGKLIGAKGKLAKSANLDYFVERATTMVGKITPTILPFGKQRIESVGMVTGGGVGHLEEAAEAGLDLYITGEPKQSAYHLARELQINALFAGHYATETFGVRAVGRKLEKDLDLKIVFIDEPTGI